MSLCCFPLSWFPLSLYSRVSLPHYSTYGKLHSLNTQHCKKLDNIGDHGTCATVQVHRSLRTSLSTKGQREQDKEFQHQSHMKINFARAGPTNHHDSLSPLYSSLMFLILDLLARLYLRLRFCFSNKRKANNKLCNRVSLIYNQAKCDLNGETLKSHTWYILLKLL